MRALSLSESLVVAEQQANRALALVGARRPGDSIGWITGLPRTEVKLVPRYKMDRISGATTFARGRYIVLINKGDPFPRRRFTLAHEFKHLIDYTSAATIHAQLGRGSRQHRERKIEEIANYFAACLLMPRAWLHKAWERGIQEPKALAHLFDVSIEAMEIRLRYLGFLDEDTQPVSAYFRRALSPQLSDSWERSAV